MSTNLEQLARETAATFCVYTKQAESTQEKLEALILQALQTATAQAKEDSDALEFIIDLMKSGREPSRVICGPNGEPIVRWFPCGPVTQEAINALDFRAAIRAARQDATQGEQTT